MTAPALRRNDTWQPVKVPTVYVDTDTGLTVADTGHLLANLRAPVTLAGLLEQLDPRAERAVLVGIKPARRREFLLGPRPDGWTVDPHRGLYLGTEHDVSTPTGRYVIADHYTGRPRRLEVRWSAEWFGEHPGATAYAVREALEVVRCRLASALDRDPRGFVLLGSPTAAGQDALCRLLPKGKEWPAVPAAWADLIRSTAPQGRIQHFPPKARSVPGVFVLDGRLMYAALCAELGGTPKEAAPKHYPGKRARYQVRATVPGWWTHLGMLPYPNPEGGWLWPAEPRCEFTTWADGLEVDRAVANGWRIEVLHAVVETNQHDRPLDTWARTLVGLRHNLHADHALGPLVGDLAGRAVRAMILRTIGAFHRGDLTETHTGPEPPEGVMAVPLEVPGGGLEWQWNTRTPLTGRTAQLARPEWSARIWGRAHARLMDSPTGLGGRAGALHVPAREVLALRTDALYLTRDPGWADDGKAGRLRVKGALPRRLRWTEGTPFDVWLNVQRDRAEDELARRAAKGQVSA